MINRENRAGVEALSIRYHFPDRWSVSLSFFLAIVYWNRWQAHNLKREFLLSF